MSTITPAEALRLSRAETLMKRHGRGMDAVKEYDLDGLGIGEYVFDASEMVALLDDAMTAKDATIKALREEMQQMERDFRNEIREAAAEAAHSARSEDPPGTY